jgi:hypothetical protein
VRDHRVVVGVGVLLDLQVLLDDPPRIGQERPLCPDRGAELLEGVVLVGRDGRDLRVADRDLRVERRELQMLLVLRRAVVARASVRISGFLRCSWLSLQVVFV